MPLSRSLTSMLKSAGKVKRATNMEEKDMNRICGHSRAVWRGTARQH
jgi:hypothetical protein